jgi:predicted nuclease with TOPRIM domain
VAGWVAQDMASVAPFMVRRTKQKLKEADSEETETLSLNTNELPYALVNSVKELIDYREHTSKRIRRLEKENRQLREARREVESLRVKVERLEEACKAAAKDCLRGGRTPRNQLQGL